MSKRFQKAVLGAVTDIVGQKAPEIVSEALLDMAKDLDDALSQAMVGIAATWVTTQGEEAIGLIGDHLQRLLDGDPVVFAELVAGGVSAGELSRLASELQSIEAKRGAKLSRLAKAIGVSLQDIGKLLGDAAIAALKA